MKKIILLVIAGIWFAGRSQASLVVFDLLGDSAIYSVLDDQASASVTNGGVVATLTASEGVLNRTTSGFGINDPGSDDTDALNSNQWIDVVFDQVVVFSNLNVSSWGVSDAGEVQLGAAFVSQGSILGTGDTPYNFEVDAGTVVRIRATSDTSPTNGFSVDSFTVETVPEPAAMGFVILTGFGLLIARRVFSL